MGAAGSPLYAGLRSFASVTLLGWTVAVGLEPEPELRPWPWPTRVQQGRREHYRHVQHTSCTFASRAHMCTWSTRKHDRWWVKKTDWGV